MADTESPESSPRPPSTPPKGGTGVHFSPQKDVQPVRARVTELNQSQMELMDRLKGLKEDLQNWRTKMDTQVKSYQQELAGLKKTLESDVEKLRSEFSELRNTLQKQQEDVTTSLRNMGLKDTQESEDPNRRVEDGTGQQSESPSKDAAQEDKS